MPVITFAAIPSTAPYNTDTTDTYVVDQTSKAMSQLNGILCYIGSMDPAEMVSAGDYIALIDDKACNPNDGGGQGGNTNSGSNYEPVTVNSSRADTNSPMNVKVWINQPRNNSTIKAYASATQAPSASNPYGLFRMDYAQTGGNAGNGYINATSSGLDFFQYDTGNWGSGPATSTLQLKLNAGTNTQSSGSGSLKQVDTLNGVAVSTTQFDFAYNSGNSGTGGYFLRSDGSTSQCFSRDQTLAAESVWSYGLYDSGTGVHIDRNSGFPIVYTDLSTQTDMNGFVGYWGLWAPTTVDATKPIKKIDYSNVTATPASYSMLQTGGKLLKFTKVTQALNLLDKVKFQFRPQVSLTGILMPSGVTPASLTSGTAYEVWWDQANSQFEISGQQDPTTYNIVPFASLVPLTIANMKLAAPWGIYGYSQMMGGDFAISGTDMSTLSSATNVVMHKQEIVYPTDFGALGGLYCIDRCPTQSDINASNTVGSSASPYVTGTTGWTGSAPGKALYAYTLSTSGSSNGNLLDAVGGVVINTASNTTVQNGTTSANNAWMLSSGRLVAGVDKAALDAANAARNSSTLNPTGYIESDIDTLTTYYQWNTTGNNWDQLTMLYSGTTPVTFDPPLNVSYTVPATGAQYGTLVGATITLQYGGFGNLWGIPSSCVDASTNQPCTFGTSGTASNMQRWTPQFSLPSGASVTVPYAQASGTSTIAANTQYFVKALNKEVRLANVPLADCTTAGLSTSSAATLPNATTWQDPTTIVGSAPIFNPLPAPRVIQGVKMY
jgi:hypothetical protein